MTYIPDLSACSYVDRDESLGLLAVGWLDGSEAFPIGDVDPRVWARLSDVRRFNWGWHVAMGKHTCNLARCPGGAGARATGAQVFIGEDRLYVAPAMLPHYIEAHQYLPPAAFCQAVLATPRDLSVRFVLGLLARGGPGWAASIAEGASRPGEPGARNLALALLIWEWIPRAALRSALGFR